MNPLKRLAGDTAIYGFATIVPRLINYLLVAYHTRILTTGQYGVFTELFAYVPFLLVLLTLGLETGFFRFISNPKYAGKPVYTTLLSFIFVVSLSFFLMVQGNLHTVSGWVGYQDQPGYVLLLAGIVSLDVFTSIPFAFLRYQRKSKQFALFKLVNVLFYVGLSIILLSVVPAYVGANPDSLLAAYFDAYPSIMSIFIANLLSSGLTLLMLIPTIFAQRFVFSFSVLKQVLVYSLPLVIAGLPGVANDYLDRILFKFLSPDSANALSDLGIYGANAKIAVFIMLFVQMYRYAAEPFFFSNAKEGNNQQVFADVMKYFVIFGMLMFLGIMLYIDIFALFVGQSFRVGIGVVPIMLFANVLLGIVFNLSMWYKLSDNTRYALVITATGMLVTVLANFVLIPRFSYYGAALAHLASYLSMVVLSYIMGQRFYPIAYNIKRILFYIFFALGIYVIFGFTSGWFTLSFLKFTFATLLLAVYLLAVWILEKKELRKIIRSK